MAASNAYKKLTGTYLDCRELFQLATQGNKEAQQVVDGVYDYLGLGISSIICTLNPQAVIIGGGMAKEGQSFLDEVSKKVQKLIPLKAKVSLTKTGDYGGAIGSAISTFYSRNG